MNNSSNIRSVTLAYFSGTGCTKEVMNCFKQVLEAYEIPVQVLEIVSGETYHNSSSDLLLIFSPVYAFRLAALVENWVRKLPKSAHTPVGIISVSGGGEVSPNTACRLFSKRILFKKGYSFVYEKMMVMPSNFAIQAEQSLHFLLLNTLTEKAEHVVTELLSHKTRITQPYLVDRFFSKIGVFEHIGAMFFGSTIHANENCNQCGLCIKNCPKKNISMKNRRLFFGFHCLWCMKCIYSCPQKALNPRLLKFTVLKNGFSIQKMKEEASHNKHTLKDANLDGKNLLWQGILDYLKENSIK